MRRPHAQPGPATVHCRFAAASAAADMDAGELRNRSCRVTGPPRPARGPKPVSRSDKEDHAGSGGGGGGGGGGGNASGGHDSAIMMAAVPTRMAR